MMYTRRSRCRNLNWNSVFRKVKSVARSNLSRSGSTGVSNIILLDQSSTRKACAVVFPSPCFAPLGRTSLPFGVCSTSNSLSSRRFYSSKGDEGSASGDNHVPAEESSSINKIKDIQGNRTEARHCDEHAWLGEQDQKEWLNSEELSFERQKLESPFLTKKKRFKNELLQRVVPWEKITVSWDTFPYYLNKHKKDLLVECAASHLKHKRFTSSYGAQLNSSSGRILLQGVPGTELYRERMVKALAHDLQVPLLVLDSSVHASYGLGHECRSETDAYDEDAESGEECASYSEVEEASDEEDSDEGKSDESEEDSAEERASAVINRLVPCIDEFAKRVTGEFESEIASTASESESTSSAQKSEKPFSKGDRVKYIGTTGNVEVHSRILLGKIPTPSGPTNAYTFLSGRPLTNGHRGEVYEVNGDQVAVILDNDLKREEGKDEGITEQDMKPSICWIDIHDIVHDTDIESHDWYIAVKALCEVLPSLEPIIVYFPDSSQWLSRVVPKSDHKAFIRILEEMFGQLSGPVLLIYGQNKLVSGPKEKGKLVVLPQFGRVGRLPIPLHQLTGGSRENKAPKKDNMSKVFTNVLFIDPPKEEVDLTAFHKQLQEDRRIVVSRNNLVELHKVLHRHELSCLDLLQINTDGVILTKQKARQVVGWAKNHYLSSCICPSVMNDRLILPRESLEIAISRLRDQETIFKKPSQSLKSIAKDDYEKNFISAVVPPGEIGVKFHDIGALEDVKKTLNELVTLPMRRPELFSHGNLLRPCKGILLFGPPGTGKTLLAKALATEAGANFISITGSTLTSKWFGDAEKLTKALFSFASKLAPVIIFVDEVDSLLGARGGAFEHEATRRMRNEFMAAWDGLRSKDTQQIIVLGATNRPFDLDDAVIRRLPRRIYVDLPDAENRMKILKIILAQETLDSGFRYKELANATDGYSGSDLKNLCVAAAYRPVQELLEEEKKGDAKAITPSLRPLNLEDFIQAMSKVGASVSYDAASMNELRKWNEQYGEGGSRRKTPFGFGSVGDKKNETTRNQSPTR